MKRKTYTIKQHTKFFLLLNFDYDKSVVERIKRLEEHSRRFDDTLKSWVVDIEEFETNRKTIFPTRSWEEGELKPRKKFDYHSCR